MQRRTLAFQSIEPEDLGLRLKCGYYTAFQRVAHEIPTEEKELRIARRASSQLVRENLALPITITFDIDDKSVKDGNDRTRIIACFSRFGWEHIGGSAWRYPAPRTYEIMK